MNQCDLALSSCSRLFMSLSNKRQLREFLQLNVSYHKAERLLQILFAVCVCSLEHSRLGKIRSKPIISAHRIQPLAINRNPVIKGNIVHITQAARGNSNNELKTFLVTVLLCDLQKTLKLLEFKHLAEEPCH